MVFYCATGGPRSRFGISVKKALGGAVVRNRIRRRIREILRRNLSEIPSGWDFVMHPRRSVAGGNFAALESELVGLLRNVPQPAAAGCDATAALSRGATWLLLLGVRFYQVLLAPIMISACKFYPSCSHYAAEAIERHGARRGLRLAIARLWRCRPFTQGGHDPVPDVDEFSPREDSFDEARA